MSIESAGSTPPPPDRSEDILSEDNETSPDLFEHAGIDLPEQHAPVTQDAEKPTESETPEVDKGPDLFDKAGIPLHEQRAPEARETLNLSAENIIPNPEKTEQEDDLFKGVSGYVHPTQQSRLASMAEGAKRTAKSIYEGVYRVPGLNRLVGKMETAWNQSRIDKHGEKNEQINLAIRGIDAEIASIDSSVGGLNESLKELSALGVGNISKMERTVEVMLSRRDKLITKREKARFASELHNQSIEDFTQKRDAVSERLVGFYESRLEPINNCIEGLEKSQLTLETQKSILEVDHANSQRKLDALQAKRDQMADALKRAGFFEQFAAKGGLAELDAVIQRGQEKISSERAALDAQERDISNKIQAAKLAARPFQDKQKEFQRIKQRMSQKTPVAPEFNRPEPARFAATETSFTATETHFPDTFESFADEEEIIEEPRHSIKEFVTLWNEHLKETYESDEVLLKRMSIDYESFLKRTRWNDNTGLDTEQFRKVIANYYRERGIDTSDQLHENFARDKMKQENV